MTDNKAKLTSMTMDKSATDVNLTTYNRLMRSFVYGLGDDNINQANKLTTSSVVAWRFVNMWFHCRTIEGLVTNRLDHVMESRLFEDFRTKLTSNDRNNSNIDPLAHYHNPMNESDNKSVELCHSHI
jgi:hypothetical protein